MTRHAAPLALVALLAAVGCGHSTTVTAADGSKVTMSSSTAGGTTTFEANGKDGTHSTWSSDANGNTKFEGTDKNGQHVTETIDKNGISMKSSDGTSVQAAAGIVKEADLGVPFYPGSQESAAAGIPSMISEDPKTKTKTVVSSRTTKDDPDKVVEFYKDKIQNPKPASVSTPPSKMATLSGNLSDGSEFGLLVSNDGKSDTTIALTVKSKKG
ncbi:MAG TPA: hypothetical protein VKT78_01810 [Fimbriimonadaceae bacterium]|nr:hypothetical protein [Fimbriimonadaceae bacterium]